MKRTVGLTVNGRPGAGSSAPRRGNEMKLLKDVLWNQMEDHVDDLLVPLVDDTILDTVFDALHWEVYIIVFPDVYWNVSESIEDPLDKIEGRHLKSNG